MSRHSDCLFLRAAMLGALALFAFAGCRAHVPLALPRDMPALVPEPQTWHQQVASLPGIEAFADELNRCAAPEPFVFDPADGLSRHEAEAVALLFNPELAAKRLTARVPRAGAPHAGRPPNPRLQLDLAKILKSVAQPWILASGIEITLPLSARLAHERATAFAEAEAALRDAHRAEWELVLSLREAWNTWTATQRHIHVLEAHLAAVRDLHTLAAERRESLQLVSGPEVRVLELEALTREGEQAVLRATAETQRLALLALMGLTPSAPYTLVPGFSPDVVMTDLHAESQQLVARNLDLAYARARFEASHRTLRLEAERRFPDITWGPLLDSEEGVARLGAGVGMELPLWDKNQRAIREACAARAAARATYQATYRDLVGRLARARAATKAQQARSAWLLERVTPLVEQQLEEVRELSTQGDLDVLLLRDALVRRLDTQLALLEARRLRASAATARRALTSPLITSLSGRRKP